VLQGAAGALLVPSSLSLINACFEGEARGRAFGYWSGASAATTILGPVIGGLLVDSISWRAAFLVNVPFIIAALYATRNIEESRDTSSSGRFDWAGSLITALAVGGLAFGAIYGQQREWRDPFAFVALGIGAAATAALPFWMARAKDPLVPLGLFRSRNFAVVNVSTFLIYGALYVVFYFLTLFLQGVIGYTAAAAGLAALPATVLLVFFSSRVGGLAARFGARVFMCVGPLLMAAGVLLFALIPGTSEAWMLGPGDPLPPLDYWMWIFPGLVVFGIGLTLMVTPLVTALMGSVPQERSGLGSAINNAISRIGPQLLGAVLFVAITASFYAGLERRVPDLDTSDAMIRRDFAPLNPPGAQSTTTYTPSAIEAARDASTDAFHLAMVVGAGLLLAGAAANLAIRNAPAAPRSEVPGVAAD
jgi:MFS family permease